MTSTFHSRHGRYYRVAREALPAGFGEGDNEPSLERYTLLPGIVVEGDTTRSPKFLNLGDAGIVTSGVAATLSASPITPSGGSTSSLQSPLTPPYP